MNKKEFYLKRLGQRGKIVIWQVDGEKIRRDLDEEFTNFGQHYEFKYIPEYEFWIDKEAAPDERHFFIDHLLVEWALMKSGFSFREATNAAYDRELSEREKTGDYKKVLSVTGKPSLEKIRVRLLKKMDNGVSVWLVDGRLVRSVFRLKFVQGGHDQVYDFVPKNEVWIDNDIVADERPYVILHELYERGLMAHGLPYNQAHRKASRLEWQSRHDEGKLKQNLASVNWEE